MTEMIGLFATAVNKMTEAIDSMGAPAEDRRSAEKAAAPAAEGAGMNALMARLAEQEAEIARLREENDRIRTGQTAGETDSEPGDESAYEDFDESPDAGSDFLADLFGSDDSSFDSGEADDEGEEDGALDENTDEDNDIMASFFSFANEIQSMTLFERMQLDGLTVTDITFDELDELVRTLAEKKRRKKIEEDDAFGSWE